MILEKAMSLSLQNQDDFTRKSDIIGEGYIYRSQWPPEQGFVIPAFSVPYLLCNSCALSTITRPKRFCRVPTSAVIQLKLDLCLCEDRCFDLAETIRFSNVFRSP